jgi:hypothetical protein
MFSETTKTQTYTPMFSKDETRRHIAVGFAIDAGATSSSNLLLEVAEKIEEYLRGTDEDGSLA